MTRQDKSINFVLQSLSVCLLLCFVIFLPCFYDVCLLHESVKNSRRLDKAEWVAMGIGRGFFICECKFVKSSWKGKGSLKDTWSCVLLTREHQKSSDVRIWNCLLFNDSNMSRQVSLYLSSVKMCNQWTIQKIRTQKSFFIFSLKTKTCPRILFFLLLVEYVYNWVLLLLQKKQNKDFIKEIIKEIIKLKSMISWFWNL